MGYNFANDLAAEPLLKKIGIGKPAAFDVRVIDSLYYKQDSGYGVYLVETEDRRRFTATGVFVTPLLPNRCYHLSGKVTKRELEYQLDVKEYQTTFPKDEFGILSVLGTLPGLNTHASQVYARLGKEALDLIARDPYETARRLGIRYEQAAAWQMQLCDGEQMDRAIAALAELGLNMTQAKKLIEEYGTDIGDKLKADPYFLVSSGGPLSFADCDKIALEQGFPIDSEFRIAAAMVYILKNAAYANGDCCLEQEEFYQRVEYAAGLHLKYAEAQTLLEQNTGKTVVEWTQYGVICRADLSRLEEAMDEWQNSSKRQSFRFDVYHVPRESVDAAVRLVLQRGAVVREGEYFQLASISHAEAGIAGRIKSVQNADIPFLNDNSNTIEAYCKQKGIVLEEKQMEAVRLFSRSRGGFFVLQGVAGGGKTFTLNVILQVLRQMYAMEGLILDALVLAPTGKAAKVASESTGLPASTIHKALGLVSDDDWFCKSITSNCVVVDEFSMTDVFLANKLLSSIPATAKVIIMGDSNQLPSIGPGAVLRDIVESGGVDAVTLSVVKRQKALSGILVNANRILRGESITTAMPDPNSMEDSSVIREASTPVSCRDQILSEYSQFLKQGYGIDDVQVLCPQKKTEVGIEVLNLLLQKAALGPLKEGEAAVPVHEVGYETENGTQTEMLCFRRGDKVIHTENNYQVSWLRIGAGGKAYKLPDKKGIINGEMGRVVNVVQREKDGKTISQVLVRYEEGYVLYQNELLTQLQHAYAMTIHKSQGSQWPVVLMPIMSCNGRMLARNLMYTGITRAQSISVIYGQEAAIRRAIDNASVSDRKTLLPQRLAPAVIPQYSEVSF